MTLGDLQQFLEKRAKHKNHRGQPITPMTIKKAVVTLCTVWNWGIQHELSQRPFSNKGLNYPKAKEKPSFQTLAEVERLAKKFAEAEAAELWECVFLTLPDIKELLKHVKATGAPAIPLSALRICCPHRCPSV